MSVFGLPLLNAILNATSISLLLLGYRSIRRRHRSEHRKFMLSALVSSALFLASYLVYHFQVGSVKFTGDGSIRVAYFAILFSHTLLAMLLPVLVVVTLRRALKGDFARHKAVARWTFPVWLYVSLTGILVYLMLYQL